MIEPGINLSDGGEFGWFRPVIQPLFGQKNESPS